ncbi:hypothetical protein B0A50_06072 [Salinomyces thailandicus]|uniref:Lipase B n=1 Tax=Salinomyces thailandicus TaxID=706561 RepID=A0A4U0TS62_9PEZI|nr:hypothetical protein B0A50_06072 [Salinomyces thailandica]
MYAFLTHLAIAGSLIQAGVSLPTESPTQAELEERGLIGDVLGDLTGVVGGALAELQDLGPGNGVPLKDVISTLKSVKPTATPTSPSQALAALSSIYQASPTPNNIYAAVGKVVADGLSGEDVEDVLDFLNGFKTDENSFDNDNPKEASVSVYPKASSEDAPYDLSEAKLRAAIHIPDTFQYGAEGAPQPAILVPGTGDSGYTTFQGNLIPLLQGSTVADPVWLNIPGYMLDDAQGNAEYIAYAINYIYGISNQRKVAVIGWSQGNLGAHWATKYWPSTRAKISDHVAFSADYHGTYLATLLALGEPLPPSLLQQAYNSQFIQTVRANGGDSAYVPTTNIYSGFYDEIVMPQSGTGASAYLKDANNVGVSNNEVQKICPNQPAGGLYLHEGTMYNSLAYSLLLDALANDGPGQPSRLDLDTVCSYALTPGLGLGDLLVTEQSVTIAVTNIGIYPDSVAKEPAIKSYAHAQ